MYFFILTFCFKWGRKTYLNIVFKVAARFIDILLSEWKQSVKVTWQKLEDEDLHLTLPVISKESSRVSALPIKLSRGATSIVNFNWKRKELLKSDLALSLCRINQWTNKQTNKHTVSQRFCFWFWRPLLETATVGACLWAGPTTRTVITCRRCSVKINK